MLSPGASYYLVLPTADNGGLSVSPGYVNAVAGELADRFGGASVEHGGQGLWWSGVNGLMSEPHVIVWSWAEDTPEHDAYMQELASRIAADLDQECVMVGKRPEMVAFVARKPAAAAAEVAA